MAQVNRQLDLPYSDLEYREDGGLVKKYDIDPITGWMTVEATIARIGVQEYRNRDGSIRREYRPADEVSDPESLKSFRMLPHCLEHPPVLLQKDNSKYYQVGFTSDEVFYDKGYVKTRIKITDSDAIADALDGVRVEISCGYTCKLDWTPGIYNGQPYDCIQRKIRGNHTAQVLKGRAGADVKLHLDSALKDFALDLDTDNKTILKINGFDKEDCLCLSHFDSDEEILDEAQVFIQKKENIMNLSGMKKEMESMSDSEKVSFLMQKMMEMQEEMGELESQKQDAENLAALHEGRATRWKEEVEARGDSYGEGSSEEVEKLNRRLKEKDIRIDTLTSNTDDLKGQIATLRQQLNSQTAKAERLDAELVEEKTTRTKEIATQRKDWLEAYQRVERYLPPNAKDELRNDPNIADTRSALYRLALQHNRPETKIDGRSDIEIVAMFDMMDSEYQSRGTGRGAMNAMPNFTPDPLRVKVDGAKAYQPPQPMRLDDIRLDQMKKDMEAWKVTN